MITEQSTITNEILFDDKKEHRYLLLRQWDNKKPVALFVTKNAGEANGIFLDLTTFIITNNLYQLGYGGFYAVNLCSSINNESKELWKKETDEIIKKYATKANVIIIAWGSLNGASDSMKKREEDVLKLLQSTKKQLLTTVNPQTGQMNVHPLLPAIRSHFELIQFDCKK